MSDTETYAEQVVAALMEDGRSEGESRLMVWGMQVATLHPEWARCVVETMNPMQAMIGQLAAGELTRRLFQEIAP